MSVMPYNLLEKFYNDIVEEIRAGETRDFMKQFYTDSWKEPDFTPESLENVIWYLKTPEDKKKFLDGEIDYYYND
tara:strand:- start:273 stop:497 length:225 start_codon:yes stop_codon:yes gene_type:complete